MLLELRDGNPPRGDINKLGDDEVIPVEQLAQTLRRVFILRGLSRVGAEERVQLEVERSVLVGEGRDAEDAVQQGDFVVVDLVGARALLDEAPDFEEAGFFEGLDPIRVGFLELARGVEAGVLVQDLGAPGVRVEVACWGCQQGANLVEWEWRGLTANVVDGAIDSSVHADLGEDVPSEFPQRECSLQQRGGRRGLPEEAALEGGEPSDEAWHIKTLQGFSLRYILGCEGDEGLLLVL